MNVDEGGIMTGAGEYCYLIYAVFKLIYIGIDSLVLGSSETRKCLVKSSQDRSWVTAIEACTAAGHLLDPGIIFKGKSTQGQWFEKQMAEKVPDWQVITSPNGWSSNAIAVTWLEDVFIPQMDQIRGADQSDAVLLILDGHKSHTSISKSQFKSIYFIIWLNFELTLWVE